MKFKKIVTIFFMVIALIPLLMIMSLISQKATFFDVADKRGISTTDMVDIGSKEAEELIMSLNDKEASAFENSPIAIEKIKEAIGFERMTYSKKVDTYDLKQVTITEYYDDDREDGYSIYNRDQSWTQNGQSEIVEYEQEEYPYRVPWQLMVSVDFLIGAEQIGLTTSALQSIYKYAYAPRKRPVFKKSVKTTDYEYVEIDNHVLTEDSTLYIGYDKSYRLSDNGTYYTTYYKEDKEVTTVKYYDYDEDDGYELSSKDKTVVRNVVTREPKPLLREIQTPFKVISYGYEKTELIDELVDVRSSVKIRRNKDGEKRGKTVTTVKRYLTVSELKSTNKTEVIDDAVYVAYLKDLGFEDRRDDILQFASLNIGGTEALSELLSVSESSLMFISDIYYNGLSYMQIELTPEEMTAPIPRFFQNDKRWSKLPYGNSTIGRGGCGPTSMAMVTTGLTRKVVSPVEMAYLSANNGYKVSAGTSWGFFQFAASRYGLKMKQVSPSNYGEMLESLQKGHPVIAAVGPGHFTSNGHLIVLVAIDENGVIVNDPYDPYNKKNKSWDPRIIISEASQYFIFSNGGEIS